MKNVQILFVVFFSFVSVVNGQNDSLHEDYQTFITNFYGMSRDTMFIAESEAKYKVRFLCWDSYTEGYSMESQLGFEWLQLPCGGELAKGDRVVSTSVADTVLISHTGCFRDVKFNTSLGGISTGENNYDLFSFNHGNYLVIRDIVILQHGGQTSYGVVNYFYLERL